VSFSAVQYLQKKLMQFQTDCHKVCGPRPSLGDAVGEKSAPIRLCERVVKKEDAESTGRIAILGVRFEE
jgi:hypothetical protein